jgi:hypothetical protein
MPKCFVIQPFDGGKYDKRFTDVYSPAIEAAGLEPYRVDKDPGVEIPIEAIEDGIREAVVCVADITTDNPNVWYELGFASASGRHVVMVCSDERRPKKFPFDIQHRTILIYKSESLSDFEKLKNSIGEKLKAILKKAHRLVAIRDAEQVAPVHGLSQNELAVLAAVAESVALPTGSVAAFAVRDDLTKAGFTSIAFSIGLQRLLDKSFIRIQEETVYNSYNGDPFDALVITVEGWEWIKNNEDKFVLRRPSRDQQPDEDIPF